MSGEARTRPRPLPTPRQLNGAAPAFSFSRPSAAPVQAAIEPKRPAPSGNDSAFSFSFIKPTPPPIAEPVRAPPEVQSALPAPTSQPSFFGKKVTFAPTPEPSPTPPASAPPPLRTPTFSFKPTPSPQPASSTAGKIPSFFSTSAETAQQSMPSPAEPQPARSPPTTLTTAPIFVAAPSKPDSAISTSTAVAKPARRVPTLTDEQRRAQRRALPALADRLIGEVIADKLSGSEVELATVVKRARAARAYAEAKAHRQELIAKYAQQTFDRLLEQVIQGSAAEAHFAALFRRARTRVIGLEWRDWAISRREARQAAAREREDAFRRLGTMGLGSSSFTAPDHAISPALSVSTASGLQSTERLDPFAADVMLHQTERSRDHFYTSATFLATTARHVTPLLQATSPTSTTFSFEPAPAAQAMYFRTLVSPARHSATPSSDRAYAWLRSKIFPADDETYEHEGITFDAEVRGRYDDLSSSDSVGLLVFEAPLQTWSSDKTRSYVLPHERLLVQFD